MHLEAAEGMEQFMPWQEAFLSSPALITPSFPPGSYDCTHY